MEKVTVTNFARRCGTINANIYMAIHKEKLNVIKAEGTGTILILMDEKADKFLAMRRAKLAQKGATHE